MLFRPQGSKGERGLDGAPGLPGEDAMIPTNARRDPTLTTSYTIVSIFKNSPT